MNKTKISFNEEKFDSYFFTLILILSRNFSNILKAFSIKSSSSGGFKGIFNRAHKIKEA